MNELNPQVTDTAASPTTTQGGGGRFQGSGLPISGGLLAIVFAGALLMLRQEALNPTRPSMAVPRSLDAQVETVRARLWQDPFAAVARHQEAGGDGGHFPEWPEASPREPRKARPDRILAVMLSAGPYDEQAERRLRSRHAVLSALGEEGYVPKDSEHIGYFRHDLEEEEEVECKGPHGAADARESDKPIEIDVPYEWLTDRRDGSPGLLLWLDEGAFQDKPLTRLGHLVGTLRRCSRPDARFTLLGPYGSTTLRAMAEELRSCAKNANTECDETGRRLRGIQILSPSATIDGALLPPYTAESQPLDWRFRAFTRSPETSLETRFLRTTGTDLDLAKALVAELILRGVDPQCRDKDDKQETLEVKACNQPRADPQPSHVALISEWDTHYGRALPCAFLAAATDRGYTGDCQPAAPSASVATDEPDWLHRFSYLRGFDGQLPKTPEEAAKSESRPSDTESVQPSPFERPVGRRRLDYLQRLTGQLRRLDRDLRRGRYEYSELFPGDEDEPPTRIGGDERGLAAIGVLGSDVYDKLLILQALREEFQHIVFFTTDLDASLLHPTEYKATRNLIVAANFGLELAKKHQGKIPPFRDGYQTALFFSTRRALSLDPVRLAWRQPPARIYEIGRRGAFDLSETVAAADDPEFAHPVRRDHLAREFPEKARLPFLGVAILGLVFCLIYWCSYPPSRRSESKQRIRATTGALLLGGGVVLALLISNQGPDGEPFALFDGISVWPSLYLRHLAAILALHFLLMSWRSIDQSDKDLRRNFLRQTGDAERGRAQAEASEVRQRPLWTGFPGLAPLWRGLLALARLASGPLRLARMSFHRFYSQGPASATTGAADTSWARTEHAIRLPIISSDLDAPSAPAERILRTYLHRSRLSRRLYRVLPLSLVYFVACRLFIILTGQPNVPSRGEWSALASMGTLFVAVPMLIILIFWVVDATRLSGRLTADLSSCNTEWPNPTIEHFREILELRPELVHGWLNIQVIARHSVALGRLVYAPVIVIVLMIASRASYFDNWAFPPGLAIVICVSVLYALYCAASVRRSAEDARDAALRHYHSALIRYEGASDAKSCAQIRLLIEEIANLRIGAFVPISQQPWVRAIALLFGGGGSLVLLEFLMLAG